MPKRPTKSPRKVLTIGHSTRSIDSFIGMLGARGVKRVVDVRTIPRSRTNPQFNRESLAQSLAGAGIGYTHAAEVGGLRHARKDSCNSAAISTLGIFE